MGRVSATVLLGFIFCWVGCSGEPPKPTKVPMPPPAKKEVKAPPAPSKAPSPAVDVKLPRAAEEKVGHPVILVYNYNPQGKTDPFKPLYQEPKPAPPLPPPGPPKDDPNIKLTPLQMVELGQMRLVAVVWDIPEPRAMVETPKGDGFILSVGTPIGKNRGIVSKIDPKGVLVMEKEWVEGKFKNVERTLKLYEE